MNPFLCYIEDVARGIFLTRWVALFVTSQIKGTGQALSGAHEPRGLLVTEKAYPAGGPE